MVSSSKLVPPRLKDIELPVPSWPANLTIKHAAAASITYPDVDSEHHGQFSITHMGAVPPSHKIVPMWDAIASKTILKLHKMALDWAAVECFECKGKRGNVPTTETTLVITLYDMPPITTSLATLILEIYDIARCRVEMRSGQVRRHAVAPVARKCTNQAYLSPGSRVSFSEGLETPVEGTVGGIVQLHDSSGVRRHTCALSCRSYLPSHRKAPNTDMSIDPGLPRHPLQNYGIARCSYPSETLWQDCFQQVDDDLKCVNQQIKKIEEEMETGREHADQAFDSPGIYLAHLKRQAGQLNLALEHITSIDCSIGSVFAISGDRAMRNPHLDWALIRLDEDAEARSKDANMILPKAMPWSRGRVQSPNRRESLRPGLPVFKARDPEFTGGIVNATKSYVRLRAEDEGDQAIETVEWAVVPQLGYKDFGESGDCGAWVVSRISNSLAGVIYAMNDGTGVSYVAPIGEIFEDIAKDTGYSIRLPES